MLVWLASGVLMVLPAPDEEVRTPGVARPELGAVLLSPAQAVGVAGGAPGSDLVLKPFGADMVYQVFVGRGESRLVNGRTGALLTVTPAVAESLAFGPAAARGRVPQRLERHGGPYTHGPLPVWQFEGGAPGSYLFVQEKDGRVVRSTRGMRVRRSIVEWHSFVPLRRLVGDRLNQGALFGASVLGIAMVLTGYLLLIPLRRPKG